MKTIIGNWKMNGTAGNLAKMLSAVAKTGTKNRVVLCVPYTMLRSGTAKTAIGAQNISSYTSGAYTGQVSGKMVAASGAKYTILGHSECRKYYNLSDSDILSGAMNALGAGLTPIICVGESLQEHNSGKTLNVLDKQIRACVPSNVKKEIIVAYEPLWAIGSGKMPTLDELSKIHRHIYNTLSKKGIKKVSVIYGGSVNSQTSGAIMGCDYVDGVLVGGASLKIADFIPIIKSAK